MTNDHRRGLRVVALVEAIKGGLVLLVGIGIPSLLHHRSYAFVEQLVTHFHLNPAHHTPQIFFRLAHRLDHTRLWWLAAGATAYALIRFAEAYGLWRGRKWAEWLGCIGAACYVPIEIWHLSRHPSWVTVIVLITNVALVAYLGYCLRSERPHPA